MDNLPNVLNSDNIDNAIEVYCKMIEDLGGLSSELRGIDFFTYLKREPVGTGPYPECTMFEASNRIMTDLVILKGVRWLIQSSEIPFSEFNVEYGNSDKNPHDITAEENGLTFCGEAFNVAPSFFMGKKTKSIKKLREKSADADYRFIVANLDAIEETYRPIEHKGEYYLFVDIKSNEIKLIPNIGRTN